MFFCSNIIFQQWPSEWPRLKAGWHLPRLLLSQYRWDLNLGVFSMCPAYFLFSVPVSSLLPFFPLQLRYSVVIASHSTPTFFLPYLSFFSFTSVSLPLLLWFCLFSTNRWKGSVRWCVHLLSFPFLPQHHCMLIFAAVIIWKSFSSPMWVSSAWLLCTSVEKRFSTMPLALLYSS